MGDSMRKRALGTPAPTALSPPLGFIPRHFRPKGTGSTTVKIVLKEKHKKGEVQAPPLAWEMLRGHLDGFLLPQVSALQS